MAEKLGIAGADGRADEASTCIGDEAWLPSTTVAGNDCDPGSLFCSLSVGTVVATVVADPVEGADSARVEARPSARWMFQVGECFAHLPCGRARKLIAPLGFADIFA